MTIEASGGPASIAVEVVVAWPAQVWRAELQLPAGSTVAEALDASRVADQLEGRPLSAFAVGIFGRVRPLETVLAEGDRVELYRPLTADPKEARRQRARRPAR